MRKFLLGALILTFLSVLILPYWALSRRPATAAQPVAEVTANKTAPVSAPAATEPEPATDAALEDYLVGVVAGEMPASFEMEALKAQAVAARTYAVRAVAQGGETYPLDGQAFLSEEEQRDRWGEEYSLWHDRIATAVQTTAGEILTYEDEPILAVFSAASAGVTETAGNIWSTDLPYLQNVDSPGDLSAPGYETTVRLTRDQVCTAWPDLPWQATPVFNQIQILDRTAAGYVKTVCVAGTNLTGRAFREALGLRSSHFTLSGDGEDLLVTTQGHGHGAGMSQYGANAMATEGTAYTEILSHYYPGTVLTKN